MNLDTNTTTNDNADNTVQVTADARSTLRALSATFTASLTVVSELLQNGRRAGATRIDVHVTDDVLVVQDNGKGLDDFGILLKIAESGWDEQVQETESPYGIGFLSSLFSCEYLGVMSKGKHLYAATSDLIDLQRVVVNESGDLGVTEIRLHNYTIGKRQAVETHLRSIVKGFPIPVFLNGEELERPHALDKIETIQTTIGRATKGTLEAKTVRAFYLQGLPIKVLNVPRGRDWYYGSVKAEQETVVHLDSTLFKGRMPDRDILLNATTAEAEIAAALKGVASDHVTELSKSMDEREFVTNYAGLAVFLGLKDVLNGMSVFPAKWVSEFDGLPRLSPSGDGHCFLSECENVTLLTREDVMARGLFAIDSNDGHDLLPEHALFSKNVLIDKSIPDWHWASGLIQTVSEADFTFTHGTVLGEEKVDIFGWEVTLVLVESMSTEFMPCESSDEYARGAMHLTAGSTCAVQTYFDHVASRLYVLKDTDASDACWQTTNFEDDDRYDEPAEYTSISNVRATLQLLANSNACALLETYINTGMGSARPMSLNGKTFKVVFDEDGQMVVSEDA